MQRGFLLLSGALLLGGVATWLTAGWLDRAALANVQTQHPDQQMRRILVAGNDLKPGDTVGGGMVAWQTWPLAAVRPEYLVEGEANSEAYAGAMVRMAVPKGEPILAAHMVKRGDQGIMAALIAPGHRAVSLAVTASSGIAGFVGPGDRVDVLLIATLAGGGGNRIVGQTVVENARVLGIDQRIEPVGAAALEADTGAALPTTVTLEVTPKQAEAIAVAQELGKLSLSLRDLKAQQSGATDGGERGKTWDSDVARLPASAFAASSGALGAALAPAMGSAAAPAFATPSPLSPVAGVPGGASGAGGVGQVERVNGVEIVRGSSNRAAATDSSPPPAPAASQ